MPNANDKLEEIFHAALEFDSADERVNFLDQACADDAKLRIQVD